VTNSWRRRSVLAALAVTAWLCNGGVTGGDVQLVATANAVVGAPATPVSYAGVARRSTVGQGLGVGVTPGSVSARPASGTPAPG